MDQRPRSRRLVEQSKSVCLTLSVKDQVASGGSSLEPDAWFGFRSCVYTFTPEAPGRYSEQWNLPCLQRNDL